MKHLWALQHSYITNQHLNEPNEILLFFTQKKRKNSLIWCRHLQLKSLMTAKQIPPEGFFHPSEKNADFLKNCWVIPNLRVLIF